MKSKRGTALRRPMAALGLVLAAAAVYAAVPSLEDDPFGSNRSLYVVLGENAHFRSLPTPAHTVCGVQHEGQTLAIYEHVPIARGVVGTTVADYTKFENGKLTGDPWIQSGTFGGMILLRGTSAPSRAISVTGDSLFPLVDGKTTKISLTRTTDRLEYECSTRVAPKRFDLKLSGTTYLVSCMRTTVSDSGEVTPQKPNYALCNNTVGFCPLHWMGEDGHKNLFDYYEVNGERFSPVDWRCEVGQAQDYDEDEDW